jgi:hypothetical protein
MFKNGNAGTATAVLTANDLRLAAERADGFRGTRMAVVEVGGLIDVVPLEEALKKALTVLLEVMTPLEGPGIPGTTKIRLVSEGKIYPDPEDPEPTPLAIADAAFVTQSAVGKFLLPYYIHTRTGAQVQQLHDLLFNSDDVIAAIHIPPTDPYAVKSRSDFFAVNQGHGVSDALKFVPF